MAKRSKLKKAGKKNPFCWIHSGHRSYCYRVSGSGLKRVVKALCENTKRTCPDSRKPPQRVRKKR